MVFQRKQWISRARIWIWVWFDLVWFWIRLILIVYFQFMSLNQNHSFVWKCKISNERCVFVLSMLCMRVHSSQKMVRARQMRATRINEAGTEMGDWLFNARSMVMYYELSEYHTHSLTFRNVLAELSIYICIECSPFESLTCKQCNDTCLRHRARYHISNVSFCLLFVSQKV